MLQIVVFQLSCIFLSIVLVGSKNLPSEGKNGGPGAKDFVRGAGVIIAVACVGAAIGIGAQAQRALESISPY